MYDSKPIVAAQQIFFYPSILGMDRSPLIGTKVDTIIRSIANIFPTTKIKLNKKALKHDAWTCFGSHHKMSASEREFSSEQVWICLQFLPPLSIGPSLVGSHVGGGAMLEVGELEVGEVWCRGRGQGQVLYSEAQCTMGNGHKGPPVKRQIDRHTWLEILPSHIFVTGR